MNNKVVGKKIAKLRNKRNMTQVELSKLIHISDKTISKWEKGNSQVSYEYLEELCKVFNVKMSYFYKDVNFGKSIKNFLLKSWTLIKKNWLTIVFAITTLFFGYYYFITIDSLEMYEITSEDEMITFDSGYYIKSKSKVIISITNVKYKSDESKKDIISQKVKLYTTHNDEKKYFYTTDEMNDILYKDFIGYTLTYDDIDILPNNLYLEIETLYSNDKIKTYDAKLSLKMAISSNTILYKDMLNVNNEFAESSNEVNDYILGINGYTKVGDTRIYIKNYKDYKLYFDLTSKTFTKSTVSKDLNTKVVYYYNKDEVSYTQKQNNKELDNYVYHKNDNRLDCYIGKCQDYLKTYDEAKTFYNKVISEFSKS